MIQTEMIDGRIRHFSTLGLKIRQVETGAVYSDAVDNIPCPYTYEETDEADINGDVENDDAVAELLGIIGNGV